MPEDGSTDERLDAPSVRKRDMDARFLAGCTTIAVLSLVVYGLHAAPFFFIGASTKQGLALIALYGALPVLGLGTVAVRRLGLEGATGLIGGSVAGAIFAYLRLSALAVGHLAPSPELPEPDYPAHWAWMLPLAWVLAITALALIALPRRETQDQGGPPASR
jgi:hypothetical protein